MTERTRLSDLLDDYRSEIVCTEYTGWCRYRSPDSVRAEIDTRIHALENALSKACGDDAEMVQELLDSQARGESP